MLSKDQPIIAYLPQLDYDLETKNYYIPDTMVKRNSLYISKIVDNGGSVLNLDFSSNIDLIKDVDGWLIPGGADIDPTLYNEKRHIETCCHELGRERAELEKKIYESLPKEVPILGICYGTQIINVLEGGSLTQHVENHRYGANHEIIIEKDSKLFEIIESETVTSKCNHHQIANKIGGNLKVNCRDSHGMIHGLENKEEDRWIVTIQWHPERCEDALNNKIFVGFMEKCKAYKKKKNEEK